MLDVRRHGALGTRGARRVLRLVPLILALALAACGGDAVEDDAVAPVGASVTPPDLTQIFTTATPSQGLGDDALQGGFADQCHDGDLRACDFLYQRGAPGSTYTAYAFTCGGRLDPPPEPGQAPNCNLRASRTLRPVGGTPVTGDSPTLDRLAVTCATNEGLESCDRLYREAGVGNDYADYAVTCGFRSADTRPNACAGYLGVPAGSPPTGISGDAELDVLAGECFAARLSSCDELYASSDRGSRYEAYAQTCGGRLGDPVPRVPPSCDLRFNDPVPAAPVPPPAPLGDDDQLDALADACSAADLRSCDQLFFRSPLNSEYENWGATCGGRFSAQRVDLQFSAAGECEARVSYLPDES